MFPLDEEFILRVAPRFSGAKAEAQKRIVGAIAPVFAPTLDAYAIDTPLRIAHFMGQVTHECAGFRTTEEFASGAAYEGRADLGNTQPGDGRRFKGRGLIQLTGRANYRRIGKALELPLEDRPDLAAEPVTALRIACEYWQDRNINDPADDDDLVRVTRLVNGGLNGLEDRRACLKKARTLLAGMQAIVVGAGQGGTAPVLRRGSGNDSVGALQRLLRADGYPIAVDNEFGAATELAVVAFQKSHALDPDGIVGAQTWQALRN